MVALLKAIALNACVQLAGRISDVGLTPYSLIKPVLKRMNLKQLATVEDNLPTITPESDEVWGMFIEKDFPDRPVPGFRQDLVVGETDMPNKALYLRYMEERDTFRATLAQRLRKMTERLQKEKSKNSITPIPSIIRNTPIRRNYLGRSGQTRNYNTDPKFSSKTILGKAMRDMQLRKLMFGLLIKPTYDMYSEFKGPRAPRKPQKTPQMPRLRLLHQSEGGNSPEKANSSTESPAKRPPDQQSPRKRPAPGIFVPKKKMPPRVPRIPPENKPKQASKPATKPERSDKQNAEKVRLSIFH